ncbi:MAG: hypothetical protein K2X32_04750 [Phycisphaerales bacterium]|nr:hypothetical protein [Phycisphaerales bacterium]
MSDFGSEFKPNPYSPGASGNTPPGPPPLPGSGGGFMGGPPIPPRAMPGGPAGGGLAALPPYSFQNAFEIGFQTFQKHYVALLLGSLIYVVLSVIGLVMTMALDAVAPPSGSILNWIYSFLVLSPSIAFITFLGVRGARGQSVSVEGLQDLLPRYGVLLLYSILTTGLAIVVFLPFGMIAGLVIALAIGTKANALFWLLVPLFLLAMLVFAYLTTRVIFGYYRVIDPELPPIGVIDAMKQSWAVTAGVTAWSMLALGLVTGMLLLASLFLLCVGVLFLGLPLMLGIYGAAYAMLSQRLTPGYCKSCGYSIREIRDGRCPECGTLVEDGSSSGFTAPA